MNSLGNKCEENTSARLRFIYVILIAFHPKALINKQIMAGLLTYSTFNTFPSANWLTVV